MTSEKRVIISPNDIISVGWECPHCHAVFLVPIDVLDRMLPVVCPNCSERLASETQPSSAELSDLNTAHSFLLRLRELRSKPFGKYLRLEIPDKTDGKS